MRTIPGSVGNSINVTVEGVSTAHVTTNIIVVIEEGIENLDKSIEDLISSLVSESRKIT